MEDKTYMTVNTKTLVAMTDANQNFSKVVRVVDEEGMAVILKNNKPKYIIVGFDEYDEIKTAMELRQKKIESAASEIINENLEALLELAK